MTFRASLRLLQACRVTLFTRANCSLCVDAKKTLSTVWDTRPFVFKEIDVMQRDQKDWRDLYEFDTPVVGFCFKLRETARVNGQIHISRTDAGNEQARTASKATKLMHRFKPEEVCQKMDLVENGPE
ncbi:MAG: hypothetical protein M1818_006681 [Claussenomyces sp. TS43310]|nr:MAG: hypothetical protein M1818_006887 [Claussenomyces sp. TS43310]KAI9735103.1 MAG: hypothetical protein M1818_006681 [Claussenomyces sp. TS43310]